jgi:hypothetical protein
VKCNKCNNVKNTLSAPGAINAPLKGGALFIAPSAPVQKIIIAPPVLKEVAKATNGEGGHCSLANEIDLAAVKEPADMI